MSDGQQQYVELPPKLRRWLFEEYGYKSDDEFWRLTPESRNEIWAYYQKYVAPEHPEPPERPESSYSGKIRGKFEDWLETEYTPEQIQSINTNEDSYNQTLNYYMMYIQGTPEDIGVPPVTRQPAETFGLSATDLRLLEGMSDAGKERQRSEERRVGKECRSRWSPYH